MPPFALAGIVRVAALLSCGPADAVRRIDTKAMHRDKFPKCSVGFTQITGDIAGWGSILASRQKMTHPSCSGLCDDNGECWSYEWSPSTTECNLNTKRLPDKKTNWEDFLFCHKKDPCPDGFIHVTGDIAGWGSILASRQKMTHLRCSGECDDNGACWSYEWSPSTTECNLNTKRWPDKKTNWKDFFFCQKPSPCVTGFTHKSGDIAGWGSIHNAATEKKSPCGKDECGAGCNTNPTCMSYEWSPLSGKCNMNKGDEPNKPDYKEFAFCRRDSAPQRRRSRRRCGRCSYITQSSGRRRRSYGRCC